MIGSRTINTPRMLAERFNLLPLHCMVALVTVDVRPLCIIKHRFMKATLYNYPSIHFCKTLHSSLCTNVILHLIICRPLPTWIRHIFLLLAIFNTFSEKTVPLIQQATSAHALTHARTRTHALTHTVAAPTPLRHR